MTNTDVLCAVMLDTKVRQRVDLKSRSKKSMDFNVTISNGGYALLNFEVVGVQVEILLQVFGKKSGWIFYIFMGLTWKFIKIKKSKG